MTADRPSAAEWQHRLSLAIGLAERERLRAMELRKQNRETLEYARRLLGYPREAQDEGIKAK
jgi:hypothetical protein